MLRFVCVFMYLYMMFFFLVCDKVIGCFYWFCNLIVWRLKVVVLINDVVDNMIEIEVDIFGKFVV